MSKIDKTQELDASDIDIIARALVLLLNERSRSFELAAEIAGAKGEPAPNYEDFGLSSILRLSRRFTSYASVHASRQDSHRACAAERRNTTSPRIPHISDGADRS